jgi:hypothetical protein
VVLFGDEGNDYVPPRDPQIVDDPLATDEQDLDSVNNPAYNIVFNFTDGNTSYSAAANAAAAMWELIITADLPDIGGVDDLRVDSRIGLIGDPDGTDGQGNTLANARPTNVRPGTVRAYTGEMGIDPADASNPALTAIIVHEVGHVLGLNSSTTLRTLNLVSDVNSENRWIGANAVAEYRTLSNNASAWRTTSPTRKARRKTAVTGTRQPSASS